MAEVIVWVCDNCGWACSPSEDISLDEAECDNCGGELIEVISEVTRDA